MRRLSRALVVALPLLGFFVQTSCGSTDTGDTGDVGFGTGTGTGTSTNSGAGGNSAGTSTNDGSTGSFVTSTGTNTGGSSGVGGGCAQSSSEATLIPLNLFIMFDDSGSMNSNNKWIDAQAS